MLGLQLAEQDPLQLHAALQAGLPARAVAALKAQTALSDAELAEALQISDRTLSRLKSAAPPTRLPADLSDRLYGVASIFSLAETVLGSHEAALEWMTAPQFGLAQSPPRALLSTEPGRRAVRSLLERIEHGFLA